MQAQHRPQHVIDVYYPASRTHTGSFRKPRTTYAMPNPLDAVSLASAIGQLVEYASRFVGTGLEIYKSASGTTKDRLHARTVTAHLITLTDGLAAKNNVCRTHSGGQFGAHDDGNLIVLAFRTSQLAQELIQRLQSLELDENATFKSWAVFRSALKSMWSAGKIEAIQRKLDDLRGEISFQLLIITRYV